METHGNLYLTMIVDHHSEWTMELALDQFWTVLFPGV